MRGFPSQDQDKSQDAIDRSRPCRTSSFHSRQISSRSSVEIWFYRLAAAVEGFSMHSTLILCRNTSNILVKNAHEVLLVSNPKFRASLPDIVFACRLAFTLALRVQKVMMLSTKKWYETKRKEHSKFSPLSTSLATANHYSFYQFSGLCLVPKRHRLMTWFTD